MKRNLNPLRTVAAAAAVVSMTVGAVSCVDNAYDLDNISKEVTVGGDEVIVPLGKIKQKSLEELIGDDIEGLDFDERYDAYTVSYPGDGSFTVSGISIDPLENLSPKIDPVSFSAPAIPDSFELSALYEEIALDYPEFGEAPVISTIDANLDINTNIPFISGNIPALGTQQLVFNGRTNIKMTFEVAPQIAGIGTLYFGDGSYEYGSPVDITFSLNGMKSVNGGGYIDLNAIFPSNYTLADSEGRKLGNTFSVSRYYVAAGTERVSFRVFLNTADLSSAPVSDGVLEMDEEITYDFKYDFEAVEGYYNNTFKPTFSIYAKPSYNDLEIVTDRFTVDNGSHTAEMTYTFNGIPEGISEIESIAFTDAPLHLSVKGLEWLGDDLLTVELHLPQRFVFDSHPNLDGRTNTITATLKELQKGITLQLKSIDCSDDDIVPGSGQLTIRTAIEASLGEVPAGKRLRLSEVMPQSMPVTIAVAVDSATMTLDPSNTKVKLREHNFDFDFGANNTPKLSHTVMLPKEIVAIESLDIANKQGEDVKAGIRLSLPEGTVFPVDKVTLDFTVNLRQMIQPVAGQKNMETAPNGDHIYHVEKLEWHPNQQKSLEVASILINGIKNLPDVVEADNGRKMLSIEDTFAITGGVTVDDGSEIDLGAHDIKINIDFSVDDIVVTEFRGKVDYYIADSETTEINLGDLSDLGLTINSLAIAPVFDIRLDNSELGIPFKANINITPYDSEGAVIEQNRVVIEDVPIVGGGVSHIVVSAEERREEFEGRGVTFAAADISRLLNGQIPADISLDVTVNSDTDSYHTIDLTQSEYTIKYDFDVDIPLEFGRTLDISYTDTVTGLAEAFADIADAGVKVKHLAIVFDFETSIPLDMVLSAELLDADGNRTDTNIVMGDNCIIHGHDAASSAKTTKSTIVLGLDISNDGDLTTLKDADSLRFSLNLRNSSSSKGALKPDQVLSGRAKVQVNGGITFDIDKL